MASQGDLAPIHLDLVVCAAAGSRGLLWIHFFEKTESVRLRQEEKDRLTFEQKFLHP